MINLKVLWVEDEDNYPDSINYRLENELNALSVNITNIEIIKTGRDVWIMVRDWKPDIVMMDHNLEDVTINGANLITEIRFHNNELPIIFYSSEMGPELIAMVDGYDEVYTSPRNDTQDELLRLIKNKFTG